MHFLEMPDVDDDELHYLTGGRSLLGWQTQQVETNGDACLGIYPRQLAIINAVYNVSRPVRIVLTQILLNGRKLSSDIIAKSIPLSCSNHNLHPQYSIVLHLSSIPNRKGKSKNCNLYISHGLISIMRKAIASRQKK